MELPDILKERHEWRCEPCGLRLVFLREDDLALNVDNHLSSDWHAQNTSE